MSTLIRALSLLFVLLTLAVSGSGAMPLAQEPTTPAAAPATSIYAPYVYMGAYPTYLLAKVAETTGIRQFSLGFILGTGGSEPCSAAWNGNIPIEQPFNVRFLNNDLAQLRAIGGEVIASFGGAAGEELAQVCPDVPSLVTQYQRVIDVYGITALDFDIEGDDIHEPETIDRRSQAIAQLQADAAARGQTLTVSLTLPVLPTGLTADGLAVIASALEYGAQLDIVNIMTMNFGDPFPVDQMGANTIQAGESLVRQLATLYPEKSEADLWAMVGLTPMIGINDRQAEIFRQADAEAVTTFAIERGIGRLAMWSLDRDQPCEVVNTLTWNCSGVDQEPYAFSLIFNRAGAG